MAFTPEQLSALITQTGSIIKDTIDRANNSSTSQALKEELLYNASQLQNFVNLLASGTGVATEEQLNQLDEQLRLQQVKLLTLQAEQTKRRFTYIVIGTVVLIGILFYITRKKKAV